MAFFSRFDEAPLKNAQNIPIIIAIITQYNIISVQNTNVKRFVEKIFRKFQQSFLADCIKVEFCRKISSCRFFRVGSLKAASNDKKHSSQREKMKSRRSPLILAKYNPQKAILFRFFSFEPRPLTAQQKGPDLKRPSPIDEPQLTHYFSSLQHLCEVFRDRRASVPSEWRD